MSGGRDEIAAWTGDLHPARSGVKYGPRWDGDLTVPDERPPVVPPPRGDGQLPAPGTADGLVGPGVADAAVVGMEEPSAVRALAVRGSLTLLARGAGVRLVGLAATILLARLISPHDIGLAALGTTALIIGGLLADGGVGVGLLRRPEAPSKDELSALLGFQLFVAVVLSAAAAAVGLVTGSAGLVAAAMLGALPVYSLRAPTTILCERNLDYAPIAAAEIAEAVAYAVVAVGLAAYGLGVWSIVIASVARAVVGTVVLLARGKHPLPRPSRRMAHVRPLLAFGFQFQSAGLVSVIRDEGLNLVVAIIGGVSQLGVWSLGRRFAQISFVLFESLWRVSYPVFSRLIDAGVDLRREIDRGLRFSAAGTGLALTGIAASAPALVPAMVGPGWGSVPGVIAVAAAGLAISGPVSVTLSGYLYAVGEAGLMLRALVVSALVWLVLASVLLPLVGVVGVAAAWTVSSWCEVVLLRRYARRSVHDLSLAGLRPALLAAAVVGPAFWFVARVNDGLVAGLLVAAAATTTFLLLLMVLDRSLLPTIRRYRRASLLTS